MCGVAGIHRRGSKQIRLVNKLADHLLLEIEDRGKDATGFLAVLDNGKVQMEKAVQPARRFVKGRKKISPAARSVLLHTRWATVGNARDPRNAHPVANGTCAAVHNGTIRNADEVFEAFGMKRHATVDSEVIPAIVNHAGWAQAADALSLLEGGMATAIINTDRPDEIILARLRSYPLIYLVTEDAVVWASTRRAITTAWTKTYGKAPTGTWVEMDDYTLVRLNGKVGEVETIKQPKARPQPKARSKAGKATLYSGGTPVSKRARRKARKQGRMAYTKAYSATTPLLDDLFEAPEPYVTQAIIDLQRSGYDYESAYEMVYGWEPDDVDPDDYLTLPGASPRMYGAERMVQLAGGDVGWED